MRISLTSYIDNDELLIDTFTVPAITPPAASLSQDEDVNMTIDEEGIPKFAPQNQKEQDGGIIVETRKIPIPPHRMSPLRNCWPKIYCPIVEHLKLQVRMNTKSKAVELRTSKHTVESGALQKGEDFVKAFALGFDVEDSTALLRLDDLCTLTTVIPSLEFFTNFPSHPKLSDPRCQDSTRGTSRACNRPNRGQGRKDEIRHRVSE